VVVNPTVTTTSPEPTKEKEPEPDPLLKYGRPDGVQPSLNPVTPVEPQPTVINNYTNVDEKTIEKMIAAMLAGFGQGAGRVIVPEIVGSDSKEPPMAAKLDTRFSHGGGAGRYSEAYPKENKNKIKAVKRKKKGRK
jgi:flagellar hook-length control protein FliK